LETPAVLVLRARRPDTGKTVRLELQSHTQGVGFRIAPTRALGIDLPDDAQKILHVVTHLVTDYIGVRELSWRAELLRHEVEEAQVEVNNPVVRTIEGAGSGLALAASGRVAVAV